MRLVIAAILVASSWACSQERVAPPPVPAPIEIAARPRPTPSPPVFTGVVTSRASQAVTSIDAGIVRELRVAEGDVVEAGQVLAILDDPPARAAAAKLPKRSKARLSIEKRLAGMKIVAPASGIVSSIQISAGAATSRGTPILRIASTKRLQLRFGVPPDARLAKGTKVRATIAGRATPIDAVVRSVGPVTEDPIRIAIVDADMTGLGARDLAGLHGALADVMLAN